ncbi:tigger transposable element-derived protein 4-like, partial [Ixodes scapularis]
MARRGPYRALTLKEKLDAIGDIERGVKVTDVATKFGVSKSTLSTIVKAKSPLRQEAEDFTPSRKRLRKGNFPQLEKALLMWCHQAWASKIPISGPLLREQGLALALRMGLVDFTASDGWIDKFKKRHGLVFKTVSGESAGVNTDVIESWQETRLQEILRDYQPADIYNADECGLVFKCLPNKTLWPRNRKCAGGKA